MLPDYLAQDISDIDFTLLKSRGITTCFFDLDHTVLHHGSHTVSEVVSSRLLTLDMDVYIATNRRKLGNLQSISKQIGAKGIMHAGTNKISKPRRAYYEQAIAMASAPPQQIAMIGDRLWQDIWGSNQAGITSVLVCKLGPIKWWDRILIIPDIIVPFLFRRRFRNVSGER